MKQKLENLLNKWKLELEFEDNNIFKNKIQKKISEILKIFHIYEEINTYQLLANEEPDKEMKEYYKEEIKTLEKSITTNFNNLLTKLLPNQSEQIILELRSAEGGQESELFALELLEMYKKLCKRMNWKFNILNIHYKESGGIKDAFCEIIGKDVNLWLMNESGVHCVKRVPKTEKKGRTHTSTATVAILKQPKDIEIDIQEKDLKFETFRSSGPGGQSVNTTDSAVRITHIPTGIVASQQDEKSQHKNKEKAMKILKARIYEKKLEEETAKHCNLRKEAIGRAKRNERIRTYHFTQNWVNDSRIYIKSYSIDKFMESEDLKLFLNELIYNVL